MNAGQARARARDVKPDPTLTFRRKLAIEMMTNKIKDNGVVAASPLRRPSRTVPSHVLTKRKQNEGEWNPNAQKFNFTKTMYVVIGGPLIILAKNKFAPNAIFRVVSCLYTLYDLTCLILLKNPPTALVIWLTVALRCFLLVTD